MDSLSPPEIIPSRCLICYSENTANTSVDFGSDPFLSKSIVSNQLHAIFILRNVLQVPKEKLISYLQRLGGSYPPDKWIWTCSSCSGLIVEARQLHEQIVLSTRRLEKVKRRIIERVKEGVNPDLGRKTRRKTFESALLDLITDESRRFALNAVVHYGNMIDNPFFKGDLRASQLLMTTTNASLAEVDGVLDDESIPIPIALKEESREVELDEGYGNNMDFDEFCVEDEGPELVCEPEEIKISPGIVPVDNKGDSSEETSTEGGDASSSSDSDWSQEDESEEEVKKFNTPTVRTLRKAAGDTKCPFCSKFWFEKEMKERLCNHLDVCKNDVKTENCSCPLCKKNQFTDRVGLLNHLTSDCLGELSQGISKGIPLENRIFECDLCPINKYFRLDSFLQHYLCHQNSPYKCVECLQRFPTATRVHVHWKRYHSDLVSEVQPLSRFTLESTKPRIPWWCPVCNERFDDEDSRDVHMKGQHAKENTVLSQYSCKICQKPYFFGDELQLHKRTAHLPRAFGLEGCGYECNICGTKLTAKYHLQQHIMDTHNRDKNTNEPGPSKASLQPSKNSLKLRQQVCTHCGARFPNPTELRRHLKTHANTKVYDCDSCSKSFFLKSEYNIHLAKNHRELIVKPKSRKRVKAQATCSICNKIFSSQNTLQRHQKLHLSQESRQYQCELCGRAFSVKRYLVRHKLVCKNQTTEPQYSCSYCGKRYHANEQIRKHEKIHYTGTIFQCSYCPKRWQNRYKLLNHENTHTRPFKCEVCGKRFAETNKLRKHRSSSH